MLTLDSEDPKTSQKQPGTPALIANFEGAERDTTSAIFWTWAVLVQQLVEKFRAPGVHPDADTPFS